MLKFVEEVALPLRLPLGALPQHQRTKALINRLLDENP